MAVANMKGGAGKSTLAVNLACALAEGGLRVALVDNDEQGSAAAWAEGGSLPVACAHLPLGRAAELPAWVDALLAARAGRDVVLVDFPAGVAHALAATLLLASLVLIPCAPGDMEIVATRRMPRHIVR